MQRAQGAQSPYEVYCHACQVSFPPETRRCMHCGDRLGRPAQALVELERGPLGAPGEPELGEDEEGASLTLRRFGGLGIWALIALSALLSNLCRGG